jgi:nicotinate-nucleotide adenylyltransferase
MSFLGESIRLGVFGGTFDPIHSGHLRSAEEVRERFDLTEVLFVPSARPPHKEASFVIDPIHRLQMSELATADNDAFSVCHLELQRPGPSYSIDTINKLQQEKGTNAVLYFIMGADAFMEIHTWKDVERLFKSAHFLVTSRPGYPVHELLHTLEKTVTSRWSALKFQLSFDSDFGVETLQAAPSDRSIFIVPITHLDISATDIRQRVAKGRSIRYLVPEPVERYINQHALYRES